MPGKIIIKTRALNVEVLDGQEVNLDSIDPSYIHVWVDGGGQGTISLGVVVVDNGRAIQTHGEYLGTKQTNNIAELTVILRGLQLVKNKRRPVKIYSDSKYSICSIAGTFNGKRNRVLIDKIIAYIKNYPTEVIFVKVKGHSKLPYNEIADSIASWFLKPPEEILKEKKRAKKKRGNK